MVSNICEAPKEYLTEIDKLESSPSFNKFSRLSRSEAYYAKKGEPIYDKEMDKDKDDVVTFDEFREYCQSTNADIEQLMKSWITYRSTKNTEEIPKEAEDESEKENKFAEMIYAEKGDCKYKAVMDSNNDNTITYREYLDYCKKNSKENGEKKNINAKNSKELSAKNAIDKYASLDYKEIEGRIETEA